MVRTTTLLTVAAGMLLAAAGPARAEIPRLINFQGRLTDSAGNKLTGSFSITFRIYEGSTLCHEVPQVVAAADGLFNAPIGGIPKTGGGFQGIDSRCQFAQQAYLEVQMLGDLPMTPRLPFYAAATAVSTMGLVEPGTNLYHTAGNQTGNIPLSNGVLNAGLNAYLVQGHRWSEVGSMLSKPLYRRNWACGAKEVFTTATTCTYTDATACAADCTRSGTTCTCTNCVFGYVKP